MPLRLIWPTEFGVITQPFGANPEFYKQFGLPGHEGLDFRAPIGSKVFACADGVVSEVRLQGHLDRLQFPYGNQVRIVHETQEGTFTTIYAHLKEANVKANDVVTAGMVIGLADDTGNSTGSHLHLTLKKKDATATGTTTFPNDIIDPTPFLEPFPADRPAPSVEISNLAFRADVTIPDETPMQAGREFVKTWRVQNTGTTTWDNRHSLAFFKDNRMSAPDRVPLTNATVAPQEITEVSVPLIAPMAVGFQRSAWKAKDPNGNFFGTILFALINVQATDTPQPSNAVIDLSHHNTVMDLEAVLNDGIRAIIHKATQGVSFVDDRYAQRRAEALNLGFLWGAYHFGEGGEVARQVDHFLNTAQPDDKTLLVLDFENNSLGPSMELHEAEEFVNIIQQLTGGLPMIYTSRRHMRRVLSDNETTTLSRCRLWVAAFLDVPLMPAQWEKWTIWQYAEGVNGPEPRSVDGIVRCDRDKFNGSLEELEQFWG